MVKTLVFDQWRQGGELRKRERRVRDRGWNEAAFTVLYHPKGKEKQRWVLGEGGGDVFKERFGEAKVGL